MFEDHDDTLVLEAPAPEAPAPEAPATLPTGEAVPEVPEVPVPVRLTDHTALPRKVPGAELHEGYRRNVMVALAVVLALLIVLFRAPLFPSEAPFAVQLFQQETVQMEEVAQTEQLRKPPPPPRPPVPVAVPDDAILEEDALDLDATLDIGAATFEQPPPPPPPPAETEAAPETEAEVFVVVEQMPEIIGGIARVYELVAYPEIARQAGLEGMVVVGLVVEPDGRPAQLGIVKSAGVVLDKAALEAVGKLLFRPGKQRNVPVRVRLNIPITFRLRGVRQ